MHAVFHRLGRALLALALSAAGHAAWCEPTPQDVTLVVGYAAGGSVDLVARTIAPELAARLGVPVHVDNIAGVSGMIAAARVALAPPDGRVLMVGTPSELGINSALDRRARFDPVKETTPIVLIGSQPMVLVASPRAAVASIDEFLRYAGAHRADARFASSGQGTPLHLAGEMINQRAGLVLGHVPFSGAVAMVEGLEAGRADFAVMTLSSALPYVRSGRVRAIGLTTPVRSAAAPAIPALAEDARLSGVDVGVWFGVLGPARMPAATRQRLHDAVAAVLKLKAVRSALQGAGLTLCEDTDFAPFLSAEVRKFKALAEFAHAQP